jgi:hypothetical protein
LWVVDPRHLYRIVDAQNLCKMMEIEFERELYRCQEVRKSKEDMEKALAPAEAASPLQTESVARGMIADQASLPKCNHTTQTHTS